MANSSNLREKYLDSGSNYINRQIGDEAKKLSKKRNKEGEV